MRIIKVFKFESNLEYVHSILDEQNILHSIDIERLSLHSDELQKTNILKIVDDLNLDENEVEVDEYILEGYKEWDKNMYNPGHYFTAGKTPSFAIDTNNYLVYGFVILISGIACLIEVLNRKNFSKTFFWIIVIMVLSISGSMFYQYYKFKRLQNLK